MRNGAREHENRGRGGRDQSAGDTRRRYRSREAVPRTPALADQSLLAACRGGKLDDVPRSGGAEEAGGRLARGGAIDDRLS